MYVIVCVYVRDWWRKRENAGCCCRGNQLSPVSSLTLSPQHLLFTFCLLPWQRSLTCWCSITPSVPLFIFTLLSTLQLSLSMPVSLLAIQNLDSCAFQSHLQLDYSSSCRRTCHFVCTRARPLWILLCLRTVRVCAKLCFRKWLFHSTMTWNLCAITWLLARRKEGIGNKCWHCCVVIIIQPSLYRVHLHSPG